MNLPPLTIYLICHVCHALCLVLTVILTIIFTKQASCKSGTKTASSSHSTRGILVGSLFLIFTTVLLLVFAPVAFTRMYENASFSDGRYAFWGSLLGGVVGGISALLTVYYTIRYYHKKDTEQKNLEIYRQQSAKIDEVISTIHQRNVIGYDFTYTLCFSRELLQEILHYNSLLCWLKGFFTEYGMSVLTAFQREYQDSQREARPLYKTQEFLNARLSFLRQHFQRDLPMECVENDGGPVGRPSVIEFLNLPPELRQCAERIGNLGLYENASELIHSDPTLSYILEIEAGGSAGLWASSIHDLDGAFNGDQEQYGQWIEFNTCVRNLLIHLSEFKIAEYERIVIEGENTVFPQYYIRREDSFLCESTTVEEFPSCEKISKKA